ncbi:MAG: hypothetical protein R3B99_05725 [Polyangiales bacterium]
MGDLIQKIIDFFMGLFGMKKDPELPSGGGASSGGGGYASAHGSVSGLDEIEGAEHVHVAAGKVLVQRDGAALIEDEDDGDNVWIDQVNKDIPRQAWVDDWGPAGSGPTDEALTTFLMHEMVFGMEHQSDPHNAEQKLIGFGYRDAGHFYKVRATVMKHFADYHGPNLGDCVFQSQRVMSASMKAGQMMHQANMQQSMQADPALVAPVEGVTMEQYAQIQARAASLSQDQFAALLAEQGMDMAKWHRVSNEWNTRMQNDTTHTLVTIYGQAFQSAGQGQFGAASAAHAATGYDGTAAGGPEPIPFEKCCEIQGAMSAWSKTGQDVNAMLAKTFNMNAQDFSAAHSWWLSQLTADLARFPRYNELCEHYEKQYMGAAPAAPDSDLSF